MRRGQLTSGECGKAPLLPVVVSLAVVVLLVVVLSVGGCSAVLCAVHSRYQGGEVTVGPIDSLASVCTALC